MKRIGYDADTSQYIFRDRDGSLWQGPEGSEYGKMIRGWSIFFMTPIVCHLNFWTVGRLPSSVVLDDDESRGDDVEAHAPSTQSRGYQLLSADAVSIIFRLHVMADI
jgi:hypothetical protein